MSSLASEYTVHMQDIAKVYSESLVSVTALAQVSLGIRRGTFSMIIGPSGSGKTTLLNIVGCIDRPTSGVLHICGQDISQLNDNKLSDFRSENIGFIFQGFNLLPVLSALENVEYGLLLRGGSARERRETALAMLDRVGLADFHHHRPNQLSGGQRQRVAIARALAGRPAIVLADEPTANLDSENGAQIIALMRQMQAELQTTFVFSTHDPQLMSEADETFRIKDGRLIGQTDGEILP